MIHGGSSRAQWARLFEDRLFRLSKPFRRVNPDAIYVFGCQKSGTSAVAQLTAMAGGLSATVDIPTIWRTPVSDIVKGQSAVKDLVEIHRPYFSRELVKEPGLTPILEHVAAHVGLRKVVFVVRDPFTNVRSMLQRRGLEGNRPELAAEEFAAMMKGNWHWTYDWPYAYRPQAKFWSEGRHYVEGLGFLWSSCVAAMQRAEENGVKVHVVRYEDFVKDKRGTVERILADFGRPVRQDVSAHVDVRFQPKGDHSISVEDFFGAANSAMLEEVTRSRAHLFGY
ncbi:MAG: hypothetical protein CMC97_01400 [Flavobacteriales bacterium]|nr:hypothetical protein [Flavobacteriales bacterium]